MHWTTSTRRHFKSRLLQFIGQWFRPGWPSVHKRDRGPARVAIVSVNYNTKELVSRLIFSICRVLNGNATIGPIVIVDNNSTDGSRAILTELAHRNIIHCILNPSQRYHGPGLNQALGYIAKRRSANDVEFSAIDYVFLVDSDVIFTRPDVLDASVAALRISGAAIAGEVHPNEHIPGGYAHVSSLLMNPAIAWQRGIVPFEEHGEPARAFQQSLLNKGITRLHFPFRAEFYLVHLWSGTLKAICSANDRQNRYFNWASRSAQRPSPVEPDTQRVLQEFEDVYRVHVTKPSIDELVAACLCPTPVRLTQPYSLVPSVSEHRIVRKPGPGLMLWTESARQPCPA